MAEQSLDWSSLYADYLKSEEWFRRRTLVMRRANGRCEGCAERDATEVHHLTYAHVTHELLFELVALCGECHDKVHAAPPARPTAPTWRLRATAQESLADIAARRRATWIIETEEQKVTRQRDTSRKHRLFASSALSERHLSILQKRDAVFVDGETLPSPEQIAEYEARLDDVRRICARMGVPMYQAPAESAPSKATP